MASVEIAANDFIRVVSELMDYANNLVSNSKREIHVYDTVPGALAKDLVITLGYKNTQEFFDTNTN